MIVLMTVMVVLTAAMMTALMAVGMVVSGKIDMCYSISFLLLVFRTCTLLLLNKLMNSIYSMYCLMCKNKYFSASRVVSRF